MKKIESKKVIANLPLFLVTIIFIIVGIFQIVQGINTSVNIKKYQETSAVCVQSTLYEQGYRTTYEYTIDGTKYSSTSRNYLDSPQSENVSYTIYYHSDDPKIIIESLPANDSVALIIVGIIFIILGTVAMIGVFMECYEKPIENKTDFLDKPKKMNKNICAYCGGRYGKTKKTCPNCGASTTTELQYQ